MKPPTSHAWVALTVLLATGGCGASVAQEPTPEMVPTPSTSPGAAVETPVTPASPAEISAEPTPHPSGPEPQHARTASPTDGIEIRLAIMERRAAELEHVATLIAASRDAALSDNSVGACGENLSLEELRIVGTSGIEGADAAINVRNQIDAWCERVSSGRHARESTREQRQAIRRLESDLGREESSVRGRRRTLLETAETLRPLVRE